MMNDNGQKKRDTDYPYESEISMENLSVEEKDFLKYFRMLPEEDMEEIRNLLKAKVTEKQSR